MQSNGNGHGYQPVDTGIRQHDPPPLTGPAPVVRLDPINPVYYRRNGLEMFQVLEAFGLDQDHYRASAVQYIFRAGEKGDAVQDLQKAIRYLEQAIDKLERTRS